MSMQLPSSLEKTVPGVAASGETWVSILSVPLPFSVILGKHRLP